MSQKLPETPEEWAATPRPVPCAPDERDLYLASHIVLKACPFCGDNPIAMGEFSERSGNYVYRIQCTNFKCHGNVFRCDSTRDKAREGAIEQWQTREIDS